MRHDATQRDPPNRAQWSPPEARGSVPIRVAATAERQPAPKPFSTEWLQAPPRPAVRRIPPLPRWMPSERVLVGLLVLLLVFVTSIRGGGGNGSATTLPATDPGGKAAAVVDAEPTPTPTSEPTIAVPPTATTTTDLKLGGTGAAASPDGSIFPYYRVISFYGHPLNTNLGVLGEHDIDALYTILRDQADAYEAADPSRPVYLAFEVIASVAQNWPAENDTYLMHTGADLLDQYARFCEENGLLLILDLQIGHSSVKAEIESVLPWLELPFVHLALDPEFAMPDGVIPGEDIGGLDASDVALAQDMLGQLVDAHGLPPKMLIVHRFTEGMIRNADQLEPIPGVQLVIDFDGFGEPAIKTSLYQLFVSRHNGVFAGIKLFYRQDSPLLEPSQVVDLDPAPDLVIYH